MHHRIWIRTLIIISSLSESMAPSTRAQDIDLVGLQPALTLEGGEKTATPGLMSLAFPAGGTDSTRIGGGPDDPRGVTCQAAQDLRALLNIVVMGTEDLATHSMEDIALRLRFEPRDGRTGAASLSTGSERGGFPFQVSRGEWRLPSTRFTRESHEFSGFQAIFRREGLSFQFNDRKLPGEELQPVAEYRAYRHVEKQVLAVVAELWLAPLGESWFGPSAGSRRKAGRYTHEKYLQAMGFIDTLEGQVCAGLGSGAP